jgi:nicotinamidase-related amidase
LRLSRAHPDTVTNIASKEKTFVGLTTLDPKTAPIVVDLQKGLLGSPFIHPLADITKRTQSLLEAFRQLHLPVVLVNVAGRASGRTEQSRDVTYPEGWTDLFPELGQQPSDIAVKKNLGCLSYYRS